MNTHRQNQSGSGLILFLGIVVAVLILAAAMVSLLGNTMHNTSREQTRAKAFDIAEAALDVTMQRMAQTWPSTGDYSWPTQEQDAFEARFDSNDFPRPSTGAFVRVWVFDNAADEEGAPGWEDGAAVLGRDWNGDGIVYVDAQAKVGQVASRIRAKVEKVDFPFSVPRGFALWSGGTVTSTGEGNNPNITAEDFAPGAYSCVAYAGKGFGPNTESLCAGYVVRQDGQTNPSDCPISKDTVDQLIEIAKLQGNYYSPSGHYSAGTVNASQPVQSLQLNNFTPPSGLVILDFRGLGDSYSVNVKPGTYNMTAVGDWKHPGALLILGGDLTFGGVVEFCGLVYVDGVIGVEDESSPSGLHGTPIIYGMMVSTGDVYLNGTAEIHYVDEALQWLDHQWATSTRRASWRELQPRTGM